MPATTTVDANTPAKVNVRAYYGDTWFQRFLFVMGGDPVDLTTATVTSQARDTLDELTPLTVIVDDPAGGSVQIGGAALPPDRYTYDVQVDQGGSVRTWVGGWLRVSRDVTP